MIILYNVGFTACSVFLFVSCHIRADLRYVNSSLHIYEHYIMLYNAFAFLMGTSERLQDCIHFLFLALSVCLFSTFVGTALNFFDTTINCREEQ